MRFNGDALEMSDNEVRSLLTDERQQAPDLFSVADLVGLGNLYAHVMLSSLVTDPSQIVYTLWVQSGNWQARLAPGLYADVLHGPTLAIACAGRKAAPVWILSDDKAPCPECEKRPALLEVEAF